MLHCHLAAYKSADKMKGCFSRIQTSYFRANIPMQAHPHTHNTRHVAAELSVRQENVQDHAVQIKFQIHF